MRDALQRTSRVIIASLIIAVALSTEVVAARGLTNAAKAVSESNDNGFRDFASAFDPSGGREDITVSPVLDWYVDEALKLSSADSASEIVKILRVAGVSMHGTIEVRPGIPQYGLEAAAREQQELGVVTHWVNSSPSNSVAFVLECKIESESRFSFGTVELSQKNVQGFEQGTLSGIRIRSDNGKSTLYIFSDSVERIDALRRGLTAERWTSLTDAFMHPIDQVVDLEFDNAASDEIAIASGIGFGLNFFYQEYAPHGFAVKIESVLSQGEFRVSATANASAFTTPKFWVDPCSQPAAPSLFGANVSCFPQSDPEMPIGHASRFSGLKPIIYALVENDSGLIVLLGQHT